MSGERPAQAENLAAIHADDQGLFAAYAMLRAKRSGRTSQGKPFVDIELADCTATVSGKIWEDVPSAQEAARHLPPGLPVKIMFLADSYRGTLQLNIKGIRRVADDDRDYQPELVYGEGISLVEDLLCNTLVFDIETVPAQERRELPTTVAESLAKFAERKEMEAAAVMGLSPFFGKVVSLAVGEGEGPLESQKVTALVVPPQGQEEVEFPDWMRPMQEEDLLRAFWVLANAANTVVSYNGRGFDIPFLVNRSLICGIEARVDLLSNRYGLRPHLDLYQVLKQGSYGQGPTTLDVVCWALQIESPKGKMDGSMVAPAYAKGEIEEIARYNLADVRATTEVYHRLRDSVLRFRKDW